MLLVFSDAELVQRAAAGDANAFGELVRRHHVTLHRVALRIVRSSSDAEDVTQNAWLQAYRHLAKFYGGASVKTWLVAIVRNHAIDHQRTTRRRLKWDPRDLQAIEKHGRCKSQQSSPEDLLLVDERRAQLLRAMQTLPPRLRDALHLWESGQYSYAEMAAMRDVALGTMKSRVCEARRQVTRAFDAAIDRQYA